MLLRRFTVVLASIALAGCQVISASITSPSDWVSGTGKSISGSFEGLSASSGSSGGGESSVAYRRDVRAYAAEFAGASGSSEDFLRGIGRVAGGHGVTHWEANPDTMRAIGEGLRDAGVRPDEMQALGARGGDADPRVFALVLEGYDAAR
ncbi:MAG: hypothetical protein ABFS41_19220 [Myxococcota bacterium]